MQLAEDELRVLTGQNTGWKVVPVTTGGFQGSYWRLEAGERRWFVKAQPEGPAGEFYRMSGTFVKEPAVYSALLPALRPYLQRCQKLWPEVYLSRGGLVVLEDLEASGWHSKSTLEHPQLLAVLDGLAELHAAGHRLAQNTPHSLPKAYPIAFKESYFGEEENHPGMATWHAFVNTASKVCRLYFPERDASPALDLLKRTPEFVRTSKEHWNTVCHGDPWRNNMFFKELKGRGDSGGLICCMVDWAQVRYCPPSTEVLLFLSQEHLDLEGPYLEHYLSRLETLLPEVDTRMEFSRSSEAVGRPFALCMAPLYVMLTRLPPKVLAEITRSQEDFWAFATGEDRPAFQALEDYPDYRDQVLVSFKKLIDFAERFETSQIGKK